MASQVRGPGRVRSVDHPNSATVWSDPGNAATDSATFASTIGAIDGPADWLWADQFGFSIPDDAVVTGITATIRRFSTADSSTDYILDEHVALSVGGTISGENLAKTALPDNRWPTIVDTAIYGGESEQWGVSLTPLEVNTSAFGFALIAGHFPDPRSQSPPNARVEFMSLEVFYEEPITTATITTDLVLDAETTAVNIPTTAIDTDLVLDAATVAAMQARAAVDTDLVLDATTEAGTVYRATVDTDLVLDAHAHAAMPVHDFAWIAPPANSEVEEVVELVTQTSDPRVTHVRYRVGDTVIGTTGPGN